MNIEGRFLYYELLAKFELNRLPQRHFLLLIINPTGTEI